MTRDQAIAALRRADAVARRAMAMLMYELFSVVERHTTGWAHRGSQND